MATRPIGILGGTFDPVHFGHLTAALGARHLAALEQVLLVPAGQPPHKVTQPITTVEHRLAMLELAVAGYPQLRISRIELDRPGPHYTVDTLDLLSRRHPDWQVHFITGMDGFLGIESWRDYRRLLSSWDTLVVSRPGYSPQHWQRLAARLGPELMGRVRLLQVPGVAVASTLIRQLCARGYPLDFLTPPAVAAYIHQHRLYTEAAE